MRSMVDETTDALTPAEAAALLAAMPIILRTEMEAMPDRLLRWRPGPSEWCALDVVGHLLEAEERGFAGRIRTLLGEERPRFTGWDPEAVARGRGDADRDPAELLEEFSRLRAASVALVQGLQVADLDRGGDHPEVGFLTINDLLHEWIHHDRNHLRQLLANVQSYAWPQMGNAQRFSAPQEDVAVSDS
jgi:DinB superfamily